MQSQGPKPCIITAAITGSVPRKENNPAVPITVSEQIESTHAAFEAGAALVHVHVRNDDQSTTSKPGQVRGLPGAHPKTLPGDHRPVLNGRPLGCRVGARRDVAPPARYGLALDRLLQLPDAGVRELARADSRARREDEALWSEAGDRGLRPGDAVQRGELRARRPDRRAAPRAVRPGRQARASRRA